MDFAVSLFCGGAILSILSISVLTIKFRMAQKVSKAIQEVHHETKMPAG
jgi:hypothetical protein